MKCTECKFCIMRDNGYSNYTVEGTDVDCIINLNPAFPVDKWYNTAEDLDFANVCPRFKEGEGIHVDVDHKEGTLLKYTDDAELKEIIEKQMMWKALSNK